MIYRIQKHRANSEICLPTMTEYVSNTFNYEKKESNTCMEALNH